MDRRFIIGVVLIIASVIAFSVLGGFLRGGTRVYTVTTSIAPGEALTADNVREVSVHVDTAVYAPTADTPLGSRATRMLTPGQLVMRADLAPDGTAGPQDPDGMVRVALADGTAIRLWSVSSRSPAGGEAKAREIEGTFTFVRSVDSSTSGTHRGTRIEIMANAQSLPELLAAQTSNEQLAAVPVGAS